VDEQEPIAPKAYLFGSHLARHVGRPVELHHHRHRYQSCYVQNCYWNLTENSLHLCC
jgi:hypothetical protein